MNASAPEDLIAALASAPEQLDAALPTALASQQASQRAGASAPTSGEEGWTVSEIVGHLCDAARYWGARMRLVVYEDHPTFEVFDQDAFARLAAYRYVPAETLAQEFRLVNASNVALLRGLSPEQWNRVGFHSERGELSLRQIVEIEVEHELGHARDLSAR